MKKICHILFFSLLITLFVSCEMPDYSDEIISAYQKAKGDHTPIYGPEPTEPTEPEEKEKEEWEEESKPDTIIIIDGIMWSSLAQPSTWEEAVQYCANLTELGYSDWRLPTVDELRTLIQNCNGNEAGGECSITDDCILYGSGCGNNDQSCLCCEMNYDGSYSKIGDTSNLWSSLPAKNAHPRRAWIGYLSRGCITTREVDASAAAIRCVR